MHRVALIGTVNWKFTRPRLWATFEKGEPVCLSVPQRRGELEEFEPRIVSIAAAPDEFRMSYDAWRSGRRHFNEDLKRPGSAARQAGWQKDYFRGKLPDGSDSAWSEVFREMLRAA
ncbi:DUF6065 family protein [Mycobacterium shigaense]|nr:DUF6065 family protein [Mycobacterium shigaense]MEA1121529.1 DUF6065 family protein [Mycobacterium shigaense]